MHTSGKQTAASYVHVHGLSVTTDRAAIMHALRFECISTDCAAIMHAFKV